MKYLSISILVSALSMGCATSFTGSAHFPEGQSGCWKTCEKMGMIMGAYVMMGEYSSGCVCQPRSAESTASTAAAGASAATVGVVEQMRRLQFQANR